MNARPNPTRKPSPAKPGATRGVRPRAKGTTLRLTMTAKQRKAAIALLESWRNVSEEEAQEQRETLEALMKAMNESRKGYRVPFPELLEK